MLASGVGHWARRADGSADLWIKYYGDVLPDYAMRELAKFKTRVLDLNEKINQFTVNVPLDHIAEIAACDWVCWIEEVPPPPACYNDGARLSVQADSVDAARETVDSLAADFLANPLIERWEIKALEPVAA